MSAVQEINPLLIILGFSVAYLLFRPIRGNMTTVLWGSAVGLLLLFLLLPGGRALGERTARLPKIEERARCVLASIRAGAPFTQAAQEQPECRYRSSGFRDSR